jgi:hypothetical protein
LELELLELSELLSDDPEDSELGDELLSLDSDELLELELRELLDELESLELLLLLPDTLLRLLLDDEHSPSAQAIQVNHWPVR